MSCNPVDEDGNTISYEAQDDAAVLDALYDEEPMA